MIASQKVVLRGPYSREVCVLEAYITFSIDINQMLAICAVPGKSARTMPALRTWELRYTLRVQTLAVEPRNM